MATQPTGLFQQPDTHDFLRPNGFSFFVDGLPNTNYTCQSVSLPGIDLGVASHENPFVNIPVPGDKIVFGELSLSFIVSEEMQNYIEMYEWIKSLGFPDSHQDFIDIKNISKNEKNLSARSLEYSDCTLIIYNGLNNTKMSIKFYDAFPTSISNIDFDLRTTTVDYLTATANFRYRKFDFNV